MAKTPPSTVRSRAQARDLTEQHLQLVPPIARRVLRQLQLPALELDDLIQAGMLGLIDAARRRDKTKTFKTYARLRIRGAILDSLKSGEFAWATRSQSLPPEMPAPEIQRDPDEETGLSPRQKRLLARARVAIRKLNPRQQQILELVYVEGKSPSEIAEQRAIEPRKGLSEPLTKRRIQQLHRETLDAIRQKLAA